MCEIIALEKDVTWNIFLFCLFCSKFSDGGEQQFLEVKSETQGLFDQIEQEYHYNAPRIISSS